MADLELQDIPPRLREGMNLVDRGVLDKAQEIFEGYLEAFPESTLALSYLGMLKAVRENQGRQGIDMCTEALRRDPGEALCYLNLSKAYLVEGDRYQCVRTLHRGLKIRTPHKDHLMGFYRIIGLRRKPVLPFLSRNNPLNQLLGRLTWKLKKS